MDAQPLVELRRVSRRFPAPGGGEITVLQEVDFHMQAGEIVAVLGRSGCGKSTLLRLVAGLVPASGGRVLYRGKTVSGPVRGMSMVFQSFALLPWLNVVDNVALGLEAQGIAAGERRERSQEVIEMIGLGGFESAYPKELSGGMRQRVGFARALVVNPDVLLMDEAFSALDVPTAETLRNDLLDLWLERLIPTQAILMVSHNIQESLLIADRVVVMDANPGRVKAEVAVVLKHPRDADSPALRRLVDQIYALMTTPDPSAQDAAAKAYIGLAHRLPSANASQLAGMLEEINLPARGGRISLAELAAAMQLQVDELFPILEALQLLRFAQVSDQDVVPTPHGKAFAGADIQRRKVIFGEHLLARVPLAAHIRRVLDERPGHQAPESRFLRELEDTLSEDEAARVLSVMIGWGRYAELFAYDVNSGMLSLPEEETADEE
jgi:NitT/TauT family transport system ATP-binding protein